MTFTQLNARLKNFLMGWLLALGLKECLVECATLCVKSEVILMKQYNAMNMATYDFLNSEQHVVKTFVLELLYLIIMLSLLN